MRNKRQMIRIDDADMREHTSFRAGGHAKILLIPDSEAELIETITDLNRSGQRYIIMGNGTNILVKDGGYDGTIVKMADAFSQIDVEDTLIHAGSGALLSSVAASALTNDLTGLEFASGIPGSIGGGTYMNAGAYGGEMKNVLERIYLVSRKGERYSLAAEEMCYGYRHSVLYDTHDIVLSVDIRLEKGDHAKIASTMKELSVKRTTKQPLSYPSAGSFFKDRRGILQGNSYRMQVSWDSRTTEQKSLIFMQGSS